MGQVTQAPTGRVLTSEEVRVDDIIAKLYEVTWKPAIDRARHEGRSHIDLELFARRNPEEVLFYDAAVRFAERAELHFFVAKILATDKTSMHFVLRVNT